MRAQGRVLVREDSCGKPFLWLDVRPHVAIRVKRVFPRAHQHRTGPIRLSLTPETCRDVEWLLARYELDVEPAALAAITDGAADSRRREEVVQQVLAGHVPPSGLREPIRPARDYQLAADAVVAQTGSLLLLDVLGLGKTFTSLLRLRDPQALPALVVTLTALPWQWLAELENTLPWLVGHVITEGRPYDPTKRRRGPSRQPDVLIINYAKLAGWAAELAGTVNTVIFDEVQELRRSGTQRYEAAARVAYPARFRIGLSATPVYNYGGEVHNVVDVIAPGLLGTREEFVREWGAGGGAGDDMHVEDPRALGTYLRETGIMLRRTRAEVGRELPEAISVVHDVTVDERQLAHRLEEAGVTGFARMLVDAESAPRERFLAAGEFDMRMRQATGIAKAPYVAEFVKVLLDSGEKVVVYAWHRAVYAELMARLVDAHPVLYTGSESPRAKQEAKRRFVEDDDCRVLLMSLRSGAGLDGLQVASNVVVFAELDWSPGVHAQCVGRLHRDGMGDEPVVAYYVCADGGSDPIVMDVLGVKRRQSDPMVDPDAELGAVATVDPDRIRRMAQAYLDRHRR